MKKFVVIGLLIGCSADVFGAPADSLTVGEGAVDPLGFYESTPTFSWKLPAGVKKQSAYRIETTSGEKRWDSGWIKSDQSTFVRYQGPPFVSREHVEWQVDFRDENGKESGWSKPASFELGLLSKNDWTAQWIRPGQEMPTNGEPVANLRRAFSIGKKIARARVYVTARGLFELKLNGVRIGNDHFANGFTDYNKRIDTLTYDVTGQLRRGTNMIESLLGSGWYAGRLPFETKQKGPYGKYPELLLQLEITYQDGSRDTIVSDGQWEGTFDGPVLSSSIYDGESYDARKEPADWKPVLAETNLGPARLAPKPFPPVRQTQTLAAQNITEPEPGHFIFDLGQNMVGWARINVPVEKDRTVTIHFAEMLRQDGTLYTANYRSAKSTDTYTAAKTGIVEWQPHFTFHGFRYVELSGFSKDIKPKKDWVTGIVLHSDLPRAGRFESSSAKLNQLQSNILWGWRGNSLDIPTDCPQRDERMGWTGDAEVFCPTAMFNTDSLAFWKSWLASMRGDQERDGSIPDFIPAIEHWQNSPGWMDAATFIPWEVYVRTGDKQVLAENYSMMEKLVGWYRSQSVNGLLPNIKGYGDWLQPYPQLPATPGDWMGNRRGDTPQPLLGSAFYARSAQILADSARILGHDEEAERYAAEAASVRHAFTTNYFSADGKLRIVPETQTAYVLAIAFDLIPEELKSHAAAHLVRLIHEAGDHLRTGFLGTPHIAQALDETGHGDVAYTLLFQETYPSWFYPIDQGATTMWERWNSYTRDKGFGDATMNSFNHYAYGAIGQWMYERVAGLAPDPANPGYKHFFVRPLIGTQLDSARAELETPYGKASSAWMKRKGKIMMDIVVPPNTTATVEFPGHRRPKTIPAGNYHFESNDE
ncbi:MAG TPA: family 78 glycoside hydrolase catalytic domain [Verrucomicrobiae bacterium]|nr:family 78 glycoside hydrolase catalytic domain [Verrucomicrobiae bacterium]